MIIQTKITHSSLSPPFGLTIGSFDGLHLGHLQLFERQRELLGPTGSQGVITFSNHPSMILRHQRVPLISSKEHKIKLLEQAGTQILFLLEFTPELAETSYRDFLREVKKAYPFNFLVSGKGDALGKGREGDEARISELGKSLDFKADYCEKLKLDGITISSRKIRELIEQGNLKEASRFLGRRYSIYGLFEMEPQNPFAGKISLQGLCLPPEGTYSVMVLCNNSKVAAKAIIDKTSPYLKLLLDQKSERFADLYLEIIFGELS